MCALSLKRFQFTVRSRKSNSQSVVECLRVNLFSLLMPLNDGLNDGRLCQGGDVAEVLRLVGGDEAEDPPHDLARPGLGQAGAVQHVVRHRKP